MATRERLIDCFATVFPKLARDRIASASADNTEGWDSTNHFLLMQVIEETFSVQIPEEKVGEIDSFQAMEEYLSGKG